MLPNFSGGEGTFTEIRVDTCSGDVCALSPGTLYDVEADFIAHHAASGLTLRVTANSTNPLGQQDVILDQELPNSAVTAGKVYTIRFDANPPVHLSGQAFAVKIEVGHVHTEEEDAHNHEECHAGHTHDDHESHDHGDDDDEDDHDHEGHVHGEDDEHDHCAHATDDCAVIVVTIN